MMNTADYLLETGDEQQTALITVDARHTYGELRSAAAHLTRELSAAGVGQTDRVGILGGNSLFWAAAYLATLKLGAVAVPFAATLTPDELGAMEGLSSARLCAPKNGCTAVTARFSPAAFARFSRTRWLKPVRRAGHSAIRRRKRTRTRR